MWVVSNQNSLNVIASNYSITKNTYRLYVFEQAEI